MISRDGESDSSKSPDVEAIVYDHMKEQLELKGIRWTPTRSLNDTSTSGRSSNLEDRRKRISRVLALLSRELLSENLDFLRDKSETVAQRLEQLNPEEFDELGFTVYSGIAEGLFSKGIKWNHILVLFAFTVELAFTYSRVKDNLLLIDKVADWLTIYITDYLLVWINNHNGWDGLIDYYNDRSGVTSVKEGGQWQKMAMIGGVIAFAVYYFTTKH